MIRIRKFKITDTERVSYVISRVFLEFNNKEGSKIAVQRYIDSFDIKNGLENVKNKFLKSKIFFVALNNKEIIGLIRGNKSYIIGLFILGSYHNKGVGGRLMGIFEKECKKLGSRGIRIRSSIFAIKFYEKMGYKKSTGIRNFKGLKVQPMRKVFI